MPDMIGTGVGGLWAGLMNPGLMSRVAQHITPNPNPLQQQGQPPQPGAVDALGNPVRPPGSNLPPSSSTQPDPVVAANAAKLTQPDNSYALDAMKYQNAQRNAEALNEGISGMAASFGTAQQQASKQAALRHSDGTVGGGLGDLAGIQKMQEATIADNEHQRFMSNAAVFAQSLSQATGQPVSIQQATEIMNNPDALKAATTAMGANMTQTEVQKNAELATRAWAQANPKATPEQIADYKANLIAGGMGGNDLETRQYLQEKNQGITTDDFATWKAKKGAQATALQTQAKQAQEFKDTALQDYSSLHTKYGQIQPYIDTLLANPDAVQRMMQHTIIPTTGPWAPTAEWLGALPADEAKVAVALQKVRDTMSADALANTKNVRNQREFSTLGNAASGGLQPSADPADFKRSLQDIKNKYLDAQATNELAAGHKLTGELVGHGSSDLLSPTLGDGTPNPYYNGGSEDGQPLKGDDLARVQQALIDHPDKKQEILDGVRKNGFSPRGLW